MDILDLGAGTGRIAIHLAESGCNVWCVEPSPAMMREFEKKLDATPKLNDKIHLKLTDSLHLQFDKKMDLAILSGTFDHFMDNSERIQALKNVHVHLKKNGILIFDVYLGLLNIPKLQQSPMILLLIVSLRQSSKLLINFLHLIKNPIDSALNYL